MRLSRRIAAWVLLIMISAIGWVDAGAPDAITAQPDYSSWAVDPTAPGADLPSAGRSLFDHLVTERTANGPAYRIPYPFSALVERIEAQLGQQEYAGGTRVVLIPMGRSLQRTAAAPDFFKYPRIVFAVTGEPASSERDAGALLKDRLYIGYVEKTQTLEIISYNELAGRFEFQLVKDYRAGAQPKVFYANRAICVSCHQNHAPIFAKAVWGETNANVRMRDLLAARIEELNLSRQSNIDFADDIDKATVRANTLITLQRVWQRGCGDARERAQAQRCRAAAFTAVLQFGLSGEQDFSAASPGYQNDFVSTFSRVSRQRWPEGLSVAQSSLPDRNPLGGSSLAYGGTSPGAGSSDWIAAAHVPAALDPLNPRPAREVWRLAGAMDAHPLIAGWTKFFATDDFRMLDSHLLQHASAEAPRSVYRAQCTATRDTPAASTFKLRCVSDARAMHAINLAGRFDSKGAGRIDWMSFGPAGEVRDIDISGAAPSKSNAEHALHTAPKRRGLAARLPDGRRIADLELRWRETESPSPIEVGVEAVVLDDFASVHGAVDRLLATHPALFDDGPLIRARLLPALFLELGMKQRSWCCSDDEAMPPAMLDAADVSSSAMEQSELQPFFRYCGLCHLTNERFPPNFLKGDAREVAENLRHCAPRMLTRLSAWHEPVEHRSKSPMPPATAVQALGTTLERWTRSDDLELLRSHVEALARQDGRPTNVEELLKEGYEALPSCLP
jgi:hypothetical protein